MRVASSDEGIKISKPGYDVLTAGDADLIFSSSWPSLPIAFRGYNTDTRIAHGLGFPPFSIAYNLNTDGSFSKTVATVDKDYVYSTGYVISYNIDLTKNKTYPTIGTPKVQGGSNNDFGIKLSKVSKDITSSDMRDFILHSRCQSPLILTVMTEDSPTGVTKDSTGTTLTYVSPLSYPSWVYGFVVLNGQYVTAPYYQQAYPKTTTDGITTTLLTTSGQGTIVALRDPLFAGTQTRRSY